MSKAIKKQCLIICGGDFYSAPHSVAEDADFIIACDKGFDYAIKLNITPDLIIGDFDSYSGNEEKLSGRNIIRLPKDKDDTDTMAAVKYALANGFNDFVFICGAGGRFDHFLCNLQTMAYIADSGCKVCMLSENDEIYVIKNSSMEVKRKTGWSLSVFSLSDKSKGVFEKGTKWQLNNAVMKNSFPYGVSNEWEEDTATIGVKKGMLVLIHSRL